MTRPWIPRIWSAVFLLMFVLAESTAGDGGLRVRRNAPESTPINRIGAHTSPPGLQQPAISAGGTTVPDGNKTLDNVTSKSPLDTNRTAHTTVPQREHLGEGHATSLNPGALRRGFYVFVGLSVLVMAYVVFRSFRLSKTRAQMVRKYGVLAHRQDVEMRPLPLEEEDDEDTTVFDASNVLTNNVQHQNL